MNLFGIGGLELVVVFLIALFVVGPVRLVQGARMARKYLTELQRQREELTQMVEEAVDMEDIRERLDQDGILDDVRDLTSELNQIKDDARNITSSASDFKSLARSAVRPSGYSRTDPGPRSSESKPDVGVEESDAAQADVQADRERAEPA